MLGFGEIFAKGLVGWFRTGSWSLSPLGLGGAGGVDGRNRMSATAVGIGAAGRERREDMQRKMQREL